MGQYYNPRIPTDNLNFFFDAANLRSDKRRNTSGGLEDFVDLTGNPKGQFYMTGSGINWNSGNLGYRTTGASSIFVDVYNMVGTQYSACIWNLGGTGQSGHVFGAGNAAGDGGNITIGLPRFTAATGASIFFNCGNGNRQATHKVPTASELNGWNFWTFTHNSTTGNMTIYRNASVYHTDTGKTTSITTNNAGMRILTDVAGNNALGSGLAILAMYAKELSTQEINQFYEATRGRYGV